MSKLPRDFHRNIFNYKPVVPMWFLAIMLLTFITCLYLFYSGSDYFVEIHESLDQASGSVFRGQVDGSDATFNRVLMLVTSGRPAVFFGIVFSSLAAIVSTLVLFLTLPIYLYSSNQQRVARAGGLIKTTLGFLLGSSTTILATVSFASS